MVGPDAPRILTPDQRPRVFVSSTLQELADERAAARAAIDALRLIPVMFELGARPHPARALYRAYLAQSHVFVGIYFARYGWVAPDEVVSGLEDEYALSGRLPRLVYIKAPAPNRESRLNDLLSRIRDDDTVAYKTFGSRNELQRLLREGGTSPVSFVPLDAVDESTAVLPEVAASIGLGLDGGLSALDALTAAFAERPFLLVVDNFEQVQAAAPDFAELLAGCPKLSVLATSRIPLKLRGERLVPLGPLELAEGHDQTAVEQSAAVQLFVDRATAVRPTFSLEDPGTGMRSLSCAGGWTESRSPSSWPRLVAPCSPRVPCSTESAPRSTWVQVRPTCRTGNGPCATH